MIAADDIVRKVARAAVSLAVEQVFFDIACGRPVDGVAWPLRERVLLLRNLRRRWNRAERARCAQVREDGLRAGVVCNPQPQPWPRLAEVPVDLRAAAEAEPVTPWRARFLLDPFRPTAVRLGNMAARVNRNAALSFALAELDRAFPTTPPRSQK